MGQDGAGRYGVPGAAGADVNAQVIPEIRIQIERAILHGQLGRKPHQYLGDGGDPHPGVGGHAPDALHRAAIGIGVHHLTVPDVGHGDAVGAVFGGDLPDGILHGGVGFCVLHHVQGRDGTDAGPRVRGGQPLAQPAGYLDGLTPGQVAQRGDLAAGRPGQNARLHTPLHILPGPAAHLPRIGTGGKGGGGGGGRIIPQIPGGSGQQRGGLLAVQQLPGAEGAVAVAGDDPLVRRPGDGLIVIAPRLHVGVNGGAAPDEAGRQEPGQHGGEHGPGDGLAALELALQGDVL